MDNLYKKYNEYMKLKDCKVAYELENALHIEFRYKEENFPHLLGLHKLTDLQLIQFMNNKSNMIITPKTVVNRIRRSLFTEKDIKASSFFYKIRDRYESFSYNSLSTLHYTDAVICFNASLAHSLLKSDFVLFEKKANSEYNHMSIAFDKTNSYCYVESFFHEKTDKYIKGQTVVKIKKFTLYDKQDNVLVTDMF